MTDKLLEGLANQGAMGIVLAILLWLFVRFFNRSFDAQTERDRASADFMRQCLATLQEIKIGVPIVSRRDHKQREHRARLRGGEDPRECCARRRS